VDEVGCQKPRWHVARHGAKDVSLYAGVQRGWVDIGQVSATDAKTCGKPDGDTYAVSPLASRPPGFATNKLARGTSP